MFLWHIHPTPPSIQGFFQKIPHDIHPQKRPAHRGDRIEGIHDRISIPPLPPRPPADRVPAWLFSRGRVAVHLNLLLLTQESKRTGRQQAVACHTGHADCNSRLGVCWFGKLSVWRWQRKWETGWAHIPGPSPPLFRVDVTARGNWPGRCQCKANGGHSPESHSPCVAVQPAHMRRSCRWLATGGWGVVLVLLAALLVLPCGVQMKFSGRCCGGIKLMLEHSLHGLPSFEI